MENRKTDAAKLLRQLGATGKYKGFDYLAYGISLSMEDPHLLTYVCKGLYVDIALYFNTTIKCVERNIRTIKTIIINCGDRELLNKIFNNSIYRNHVPTNAEFIDGLAAYLKENSED